MHPSRSFASLFVAAFAAHLAACTGTVDPPAAENPDSTDSALSLAGVTAARITHDPGYVAVVPPDTCALGAGTASADFAAKTLHASLCLVLGGGVGAQTIAFDRVLSDAEVLEIKTALAGVRVVPPPAGCVEDVATGALTLIRPNGPCPPTAICTAEENYADANAFCNSRRGTPVDSSGLKAAFDVVERIARSTTCVLPPPVPPLPPVITTSSTGVRVTFHPGYVAVPQPDQCPRGQGALDLDLITGRLEGKLCFAPPGSARAELRDVGRTLSAQELQDTRTHLTVQLRELPPPTVCPTDSDGGLVDVRSAAGVASYVDARNSCSQTARKPIDNADLRRAFEGLAALVQH